MIAAALCLLGPAPVSATPGWLAPADLSASGRDASDPVVAIDAGGDIVAAWERQSVSGPSHIVQVATRTAGGSFTAPVPLAEPATRPLVAMTPGGEAVVAWWRFANPPGVYVLELATRPPGAGSFSAPVEVAALPPGVLSGAAHLAINAAGDVALAWTSRDPASVVDPGATFVEASVRPAGGAFSTPEPISPQPVVKDEDASLGSVAIEGSGEAIVVWEYEAESSTVIEAGFRPPAGPFSAPVEVNPPLGAGEYAVSPDVAADAAGDVAVAWVRADATTATIEVADRSAGAFPSSVPVSDDGRVSVAPQIELGAGGRTTLIWDDDEGTSANVEASRRAAPGQVFSAPQDVSPETGLEYGARLAMSAAGEAIVTWSESDGAEVTVRAALAAPGADFSPPAEISAPSLDVMLPATAVDASGDAAVVWPRSDGSHTIVQLAGYDAFVPELRNVAVPATGTAGVPVEMSAAPFDVWPVGAARFDFGDGGSAGGNAVSHAYAAPGAYQVTIDATDTVGAKGSAQRTIAITAPNDFRFGKLALDRRRGTGTLTVIVPWSGEVSLSGSNLRPASVRAGRAGSVKLPIRTRGKGRARLRERGRLRLLIKASFAPDGGSRAARTRSATLVDRRG